jgi:hypothetical protein
MEFKIGHTAPINAYQVQQQKRAATFDRGETVIVDSEVPWDKLEKARVILFVTDLVKDFPA